MRFMVFMKADQDSEAGVLPGEELIAAMMQFNEELVKAGVLLGAEGLHPSSRGARVRFAGGERTVIDGPFPHPEELVAGFWMIEVGSREEAIDWVERVPNPGEGNVVIEIRQVFEADDFGDQLTPRAARAGRAHAGESREAGQVAGGARTNRHQFEETRRCRSR